MRYPRVVRIVALFFSLVLVVGGLGVVRGYSSSTDDARATHIVVLHPGVNGLDVARQHAVGVTSGFEHIFNGFAAVVPEGRLTALQHDPRVVSVEPNAEFELQEQTLPTGVDRVDADLNQHAKIDGVDERVNAVVAVMDSGVEGTHPDLNVNVAKSVDCTTSGSPCTSGVATDGSGHGTHVAGTIGALDNGIGVVGVAPGAEIWSIRVCASGCYLEAVLKGQEYISQNADQVAAVNISLGGTGWSTSWRSAIQDNVSRGVVVVVAAGNSKAEIYGGDGTIGNGNEFQPAAFPEVMTVSALVDTDGKVGGTGSSTNYGADDTLASFSNYSTAAVSDNPVSSPGAAIDVAAPGYYIFSTIPGGYGYRSGTSMASPHTAGAVALYIAEHGRATSASGVAAIRQAIIDAGQPTADWRPDTLDTDSDRDPNHEGLAYPGSGFAPPSQATHDVAATGVAVPSSVMKGETATVSVTVGNNGSVSETIEIVLQDTAPSVSVTTIGSQVVTLAPAESQTVSFVWDTANTTAGTHTLTAEAQLSGDENSGNNAASAIATVESALTDLSVSAMTASPSSITEGTEASVSIAVDNTGNQDVTGDVSVTLRDETNNVTVGEQTISGGLAAAGTVSVMFTWDTSGTTGDITLTASHNLTDDDTTNNSTSLTITVSPAVHDVAVTGIGAPSSLIEGDSANVAVAVSNSGSGSETFTVLVENTDPSGTVTVIGSQSVTLAAGEATTLSFAWDTTGAATGDHGLIADAQLSDDDTSNNLQSATVSVQAAITDLSVASMTASPDSISQGAEATVSVTVANIGNQDVTGDVSVTLRDETNGVTIGQQTIPNGLASGTSVAVAFAWDTSTVATGDITLAAIHNLPDDDGSNNVSSLVVTISPPPPTTMHVSDLDALSSKLAKGQWSAQVAVLVVDNYGAAVEGATVTGTFSQGSSSMQVSCITGLTGGCTVDSGTFGSNEPKASFTVDTLAHSSLSYDQAGNGDPDGDSNGTTITFTK